MAINKRSQEAAAKLPRLVTETDGVVGWAGTRGMDLPAPIALAMGVDLCRSRLYSTVQYSTGQCRCGGRPLKPRQPVPDPSTSPFHRSMIPASDFHGPKAPNLTFPVSSFSAALPLPTTPTVVRLRGRAARCRPSRRGAARFARRSASSSEPSDLIHLNRTLLSGHDPQ